MRPSDNTPFKFLLRSLRTPVWMPSSVLEGVACEACEFEEDAASEARDGSMMNAAVPCEVAPIQNPSRVMGHPSHQALARHLTAAARRRLLPPPQAEPGALCQSALQVEGAMM